MAAITATMKILRIVVPLWFLPNTSIRGQSHRSAPQRLRGAFAARAVAHFFWELKQKSRELNVSGMAFAVGRARRPPTAPLGILNSHTRGLAPNKFTRQWNFTPRLLLRPGVVPAPEAIMATPVAVTGTEERGDMSLVSWGAVIAGAIAAAAVTLLLLAFGVGLGLSVVSPWANEGVSATTFHVFSGIYLIVVAMLASTVGGLLAGRLRARWVGTHRDEVFFRDTAHGFLAWALATVLSAAVLGSATTHLLAGASAGSIPAAGAAATTATNPSDTYVDALLRAAPAPAGSPGSSPATAGTTDSAAMRAELGRIFTTSQLRRAEIPVTDRTYMARVVSARTGLSPEEGEKRVTEVINQAKATAGRSPQGHGQAFILARGVDAGRGVRRQPCSDRGRRVP